MGGVPVNQIVLQRDGDVEYYKSVPQTNFEMLGLNMRSPVAVCRKVQCAFTMGAGKALMVVLSFDMHAQSIDVGLGMSKRSKVFSHRCLRLGNPSPL